MPLDSETERLFRHLASAPAQGKEKRAKGKPGKSGKDEGKKDRSVRDVIFDAGAKRLYSSWDKKIRGKLLKLVATYFRSRFPTCAFQAYWFALWTELYVPTAGSPPPFGD